VQPRRDRSLLSSRGSLRGHYGTSFSWVPPSFPWWWLGWWGACVVCAYVSLAVSLFYWVMPCRFGDRRGDIPLFLRGGGVQW